MSRASRRQKEEQKIRVLEAEFREQLIAALRKCAAGQWGLFGQNEPQANVAVRGSHMQVGDELVHLGERIVSARTEIGESADFPLLSRFLQYRTMRGPNDPGEPKLAREFLKELNV